jgi:outer membrane cobalamin receptor
MDLDGTGKLVKLNGFETFNAGIRYFRARDEFGLQMQNLLDREYEELYGYSVMPRSIFLDYSVKF